MTTHKAVLQELMETIEGRKKNPSSKSYTTQLLEGGVDTIGAKILEEAGELVEAAGEDGEVGRKHLVDEAADLTYHMLVLLGYCDLSLGDVEAELARRFGTSGLQEKASRSAPPPGGEKNG